MQFKLHILTQIWKFDFCYAFAIDNNKATVYRVRSDKDRTGTITIVPVRTGTVILEKYRKF